MTDDKKREFQEKDFVDRGEEREIKRRKRSRKTIGEEGSRKQTAIGLLVTIVLGLMFYFPAEIKQWWQRFNSPEVITILKPIGDESDVSEIVGFKVKIKKKEDVEEVIGRLLEGLEGDYGVWVMKLDGKGQFGINESKVLSAASVIKLPLLVAYYQAADEGKLDPEEIYVLKERDRLEYGTGSMQNQPEGTEYTYREIAHLVANQSDNMGAELLIGFLGGAKQIEGMINDWALTATSVKEGGTTAGEIGELLMRLYDNELISKKSQKELFKNLTETVNEDRITAGVPTGVKVVHKFGSEEGIVNDCGIVYGAEPYVICMLSTGVNDAEAQEVLPKISRVVWEWAGR
jgi:beta-lactamase class A